jgi:[protein-PII] uridylyltransferase
VSPSSPIVTPEQVESFLRGLPFAMDRSGFLRFALGFPTRYLATTPAPEVVRHYALQESMGSRPVISSISRDGELWKLNIVAKERRALFSRIAGALSCSGMNIVSAEAFANASSLILDTFRIADGEARFQDPGERRRFQVFLEDVVEGKTDIEAELRKHPEILAPQTEPLSVEWDETAHPTATRLSVGGRDRRGLLYRLSRTISEAGVNIETAYIETPGEQVRDEFFLTRDGRKLDANEKAALATSLEGLTGPAQTEPST